MTGAGRPLRFLAVTLGGWTAVRVAILWPTIDSIPSLVHALAPPVAAATRSPDAGAPPAAAVSAPRRVDPTEPVVEERRAMTAPPPGPVLPVREEHAPDRPSLSPPRQPPPLRPAPIATPPDRWAASAWAIARGGRADALTGGQLGASQAGVRVTYALGKRIAVAARLSAPFRGRGAEVGIGIDWQPTAAPIHLVAEQRLALDGGRGGTAIFVVGGLDPTPLTLGFSIDAYGQAGGIRRGHEVIGFADGAARVARRVTRIGRTRLELGVGSWGGIQPGAARLDVGPSAALIAPIGGRAVRFTLDWRQRIAGRARPGSGPALSIGSDF